MTATQIIWLAIAAVFVFGALPFLILGAVLWSKLLVRTSKKKWGRECSIPDDEEYRRMFDIGIEWDGRYAAYKKPVEIKSGRFRLKGEYFDFGAKRAVIIIAGRMESLLYSYFFAEPYRAAGYNVLVIDNRAHGESDGVISSLGYREYKDILRKAVQKVGGGSALGGGGGRGLRALTRGCTPRPRARQDPLGRVR